MRLLLDEMLPRKLAPLFAPNVEAITVRRREWDAKTNGELLTVQEEFDALLTMHRSLSHQQNLANVDLVIALLKAPSNRLADLAPLVDEVKNTLPEARPGEVVRVQSP